MLKDLWLCSQGHNDCVKKREERERERERETERERERERETGLERNK
jgi:hypothetical protein